MFRIVLFASSSFKGNENALRKNSPCSKCQQSQMMLSFTLCFVVSLDTSSAWPFQHCGSSRVLHSIWVGLMCSMRHSSARNRFGCAWNKCRSSCCVSTEQMLYAGNEQKNITGRTCSFSCCKMAFVYWWEPLLERTMVAAQLFQTQPKSRGSSRLLSFDRKAGPNCPLFEPMPEREAGKYKCVNGLRAKIYKYWFE